MSRSIQILGVVLCLAGGGAAVYVGRTKQKPLSPLDERLQGRFELFRYVAPPDLDVDDPIAKKHRWIYEFGADHLFELRVLVDQGWEMERRAGTVVRDGDVLLMHVLAVNGVRDEAPPERFFIRWENDEAGEFLHLTGEMENGRGQQLYLRRVVD